jgi:hypothetical protein
MITRRNLIIATPALFVPVQTPAAASNDLGDASLFSSKANQFLAKLSPEQSAEARFPFDGEVHRRWNFMGTGGFIKPGLRLETMQPGLKQETWNMLSQVLSERGLTKARDVMILQQVLIDQGSSPASRHPERYSIAIFGLPTATETWALRLEGHHLSLTFTIRNDRLIGITPSSFSVNPNRVQGGFKNGLITLKREDDLARRLAKDLAGTGRTQAFFSETPLRNIQATAGSESPFETKAGIAVADLLAPQRDLLAELIDAYTVEHVATPFANAVSSHLRNDINNTAHFAFAGARNVGERAYYRIHGDRVLIEFAAVDAEAQHLHTIFHMT